MGTRLPGGTLLRWPHHRPGREHPPLGGAGPVRHRLVRTSGDGATPVTSFPWYVARAAGLVSWVLLTAGVLWGLAISTRGLRGRPPPAWLLDLHPDPGGLATVFPRLHVLAVPVVPFVHF